MLALLNEASFCLLTSHNRRQRTEVVKWLAGACLVSFEQACSALDLDPEALWEGLERLALRGGEERRGELRHKYRSG